MMSEEGRQGRSGRPTDPFANFNVEPGTMLIDTAAQIPLIGLENMKALGHHLKGKGKTGCWTSSEQETTGGLGGECDVIGRVKVPIGLAGKDLSLEMKVTNTNVPPLIPRSFLKNMEVNVDYGEETITWRKLGNRNSKIRCLSSTHISCRVDELSLIHI